MHLLHLGAGRRQLALELLGLGSDASVALVNLGFAPLQGLALGGDACAFLRQALLGVGEA